MITKEMLKEAETAYDLLWNQPHTKRLEAALTAALSAAETQGYKLIKIVRRERPPFVIADGDVIINDPVEDI